MEIGRRLLLARDSADDNTARLDRLEFDRRFGLARGRLEAICGSLIGVSDAPDVVHDVYLQARSRIHQLRDPDALEA